LEPLEALGTFGLATMRKNSGIFVKGKIIPMKQALLPHISVLLAGFVASAAGSNVELQNNASGESHSAALAIYAKRCASCHGKDGRANTFKGKLRSARNLTDPQWQADVSDERIFNSITNGRGKMPRYGKKLSEAEINSLVSYVRGLKKIGGERSQSCYIRGVRLDQIGPGNFRQ
jgi:mono/diheme cytochrome c family protein